MATNQRVFRAYLAAHQLLKDLKTTHLNMPISMLDIGGAHGIHARFFRESGINVDIVDIDAGDEEAAFIGDYLSYNPGKKYDVIWSSHVLEHVSNTGVFLGKIREDMNDDGYCAITVPPFNEENMAYNHVSLWNPGILLLNAAYAGFNCSTARLKRYGYNISLIARKGLKQATREYIVKNFPLGMQKTSKHFRGNARTHNWDAGLDDMKISDLTGMNEIQIKSLIGSNQNISFFYSEHDRKKVLNFYEREKKTFFRCR